MPAPTLELHPKNPEPRKLAEAVSVLDEGGVILYPTDTVYALGCALESKKGLAEIRRLRGMNESQKLALLCADLANIARYAVVSSFAYRQMRRLLPGPYTIILEATREVPKILLDKRRTVGIRVPANPICQALIHALGRPLLTSSAIPRGAEHAVVDVDEAREVWPHGIDLFIDGGPTPGEMSTVVSLVDDEIEILREGLGVAEL